MDTLKFEVYRPLPGAVSCIGVRVQVQSMSSLSVPFKNWFNVFLWCCSHIMLKRSKVPLTKPGTFTVRVNDPPVGCVPTAAVASTSGG